MGQIYCKVTPNAVRNELLDWTTDERGGPVLRVRLKAPPIDGKANRELTRFLSTVLKLPESTVSLERGQGSRTKRIGVSTLDDEEIRARVDRALS